ncbi:uncharacterized protein G2W53_034318 [Senna tora]|uniref:Uncharacterized protein n=1 Tax=Senna tora TaxID=362788 RepID=A0A834T1N9_9FABA|nr:uncharacterized protein G2W53_034318 [Senna tora]
METMSLNMKNGEEMRSNDG